MSFQSRQKKRRYKRIEAQKRRAKRSSETPRRWFLTLAKKPGDCAGCGDRFERGGEIVFRAEPREVCCLRCADRERVPYRTSVRWQRERGRRRARV